MRFTVRLFQAHWASRVYWQTVPSSLANCFKLIELLSSQTLAHPRCPVKPLTTRWTPACPSLHHWPYWTRHTGHSHLVKDLAWPKAGTHAARIKLIHSTWAWLTSERTGVPEQACVSALTSLVSESRSSRRTWCAGVTWTVKHIGAWTIALVSLYHSIHWTSLAPLCEVVQSGASITHAAVRAKVLAWWTGNTSLEGVVKQLLGWAQQYRAGCVSALNVRGRVVAGRLSWALAWCAAVWAALTRAKFQILAVDSEGSDTDYERHNQHTTRHSS